MIKALLSLLFAFALAVNPQELIEKAGEHFDNGRFRETAELLSGALPELRDAGDEESLAEALSMLAVSYSRLGALDQALEAQRECFEIDLKGGDPGNISSSLNNMAGFCLAMDNLDEAEKFIREAISYEEKLGPSAALAVRYGMASDILQKKGLTEEAVAYAEKALEMDNEAGRVPQAAVRKSQLAAGYMDLGRLDEAWKLLDEAADVFDKTGNLHSLAVCRQQQGTIAAKRGNFTQSAHYLREALTLCRQTGNLLLQRNISQDLAVVLKDTDPRAAVGYMQDVVTLSDSLYRAETARKVAEISIQQDLAGKEKQLADQENSLRLRSSIIGLLIACLVLLTTLLAVAWRALHLRKKNEELLQKTSEIKDRLLMLGTADPERRDSEVNALMSELNEVGGQVPDKTLTPREREIALLCCDGLLSKEIADRLNISQRTVETHKNNIFRKLGINTTAELVELMKRITPPQSNK